MKNLSEIYFGSIKKIKPKESIFGLKSYLKRLFKKTNLEGKTVLDIGAGSGIYSCYMAMNGAKNVFSLEPEIEGSENNYIKKFQKLKDNLKLSNVFLEQKTFQLFDSKDRKFDIILLHYSVNHLNEEACINLNKNEEAKEIYAKIFEKLYSILNEKAQVIIADCSNNNIFKLLKTKNPFAPTIEWNKHQSPEEWVKILKEAGFGRFNIKWVAPKQFGLLGNFFLGNKFFSFLIDSHFIIYVER